MEYVKKHNYFICFKFCLFVFIFQIQKTKPLKINFDFKRLKNTLLLDKSLIVPSVSFVILLIVIFVLAMVIPVLEPDSQTYHFIRAYDFVKFKSLNHFEINDIRVLVMPINSEIIYAWMYLFKKTLRGYGILSHSSFIVFILSFWQILEKLKFCYRKRLFAIFVFSSFSSIIVQISSLQTILTFILFFIINFTVFSSYNYISNFIQFHNFLGNI